MKKSILSTAALFLLAFGAMSISAQTTPGKIVIINSDAFRSEKTGITKYENAIKAFNLEMAPVQKELETMSTKLGTLGREIETLRTQAANGTPINEASAQAKVDEAEKLQIDIKRKEEDAKVLFARRQPIIVGTVAQQVAKALGEFAKAKGYSLIFDISKDQVGFLVAVGDDKVDVTAEFVTYFNARP